VVYIIEPKQTKQMMKDTNHIFPNDTDNLHENDSADLFAPVSYFITGFGPFGEVTENPTSAMIDCLLTEKNAHNPKLRHVHMLEVVRVAASSATQQVNRMMERIMDTPRINNKERRHGCDDHVVLLHLGVLNHQRRRRRHHNDHGRERTSVAENNGAHDNQSMPISFQLEQNAFNEAHFRIPDNDGWKPTHEQITLDKELGHRLLTDLNVKRIRDSLIQKGFDVFISGDAGRFLCNYIYWESLNKLTTAEEVPIAVDCNLHALFVHVPSFDCISKDVQVAFVMELIETISECIACPEEKKGKH